MAREKERGEQKYLEAILALHYDRLLPRKWLKIGKNSQLVNVTFGHENSQECRKSYFRLSPDDPPVAVHSTKSSLWQPGPLPDVVESGYDHRHFNI